jgi:hypothetical protein
MREKIGARSQPREFQGAARAADLLEKLGH